VNAANAAEKYGAPLTLGIERANGASENVTLTPRRSEDAPDRTDHRQS